jgi:hypothetical protein
VWTRDFSRYRHKRASNARPAAFAKKERGDLFAVLVLSPLIRRSDRCCSRYRAGASADRPAARVAGTGGAGRAAGVVRLPIVPLLEDEPIAPERSLIRPELTVERA